MADVNVGATKMAAIGQRDAVMAFKAAGLDVFPAEDPIDIAHTINRLAVGGYSVLFISEEAAQMVPETIKRYKAQAYPVLLPIPGTQGSNGMGMHGVQENIDKAVGANIIRASDVEGK